MAGAIPLSDASRRPTNFPIVTLSIVIINLVVFVLELANGDAFVSRWAMVPANVSSGRDLVTVLTAMFMHASWSHIIGNMIFLWAFGPEIEDEMGPLRYAIFYLLGGIAAAATQVAFYPHSTVPNLGASGAIAAVMGAFLVTFPRDNIRTILVVFVFISVAYVPAVILIGLWFLSQLWSAGAVAPQAPTGVAYLAHIGGFLFGAVFARLFERGRRMSQPF
jgi:membrane associated rhomboid family serine protease